MKAKILALLVFVLLALPFAVMAQEEIPVLPEWTAELQGVLFALVLFNFKTTDVFKRMLASEKFGGARFTPSKEVQSVLVLFFSIGLGIASAFVTPDATTWLPDAFLKYPYIAYVITGVSVSTVGGIVHQTLARLFPATPAPEAPKG